MTYLIGVVRTGFSHFIQAISSNPLWQRRGLLSATIYNDSSGSLGYNPHPVPSIQNIYISDYICHPGRHEDLGLKEKTPVRTLSLIFLHLMVPYLAAIIFSPTLGSPFIFAMRSTLKLQENIGPKVFPNLSTPFERPLPDMNSFSPVSALLGLLRCVPTTWPSSARTALIYSGCYFGANNLMKSFRDSISKI